MAPRRRPALLLSFGCAARAATYYVTISGLGGEPDYEQRFDGLASDLDKLLKDSGGDLHVYTLIGKRSLPRAHQRHLCHDGAKQAKPEDDFVVILIGHGSFDGSEYKFNIPGPDISGSDLAALCDKIPAKRQLIVNTTSASGGSVAAFQKARPRGHHRHQERHREKRHGVRALLGGGTARSRRRRR